MPATYKILMMGASYGSLLASKILFGGHSIHMVCLPAEADLINAEGFRVRMPVKGRKDLIEIDSRKLPGKVTAGAAAGVNPKDYDLVGLAMQEPQYRSPGGKANKLLVTLPTNFKVAKFDNDKYTQILRDLEKGIDAIRFDTPEGKIELPVKLRVHDSIFVPLAKWSMLLAGNYRCITKDGMRTAKEAVHSNIEESKSVYNFVFDLCVKLGANPSDLVPFEKYAAAALSLSRPASAARALFNGAPNIERCDKLVQLIAKQKGLSNPVIDAGVALVDELLAANRKKAAA